MEWWSVGVTGLGFPDTPGQEVFVVAGEGATVVGDKTMDWSQHDSFAVPNWAWHGHVNRSKTQEAILFSVNDTPIVSAFGHYRKEPENSLHTGQPPPIVTPPGH